MSFYFAGEHGGRGFGYFLVIAGDLYNSADRSLGAELAFQRGMRRLADAGIPAFVVHGNHDPADGWSAGLEIPDSVVAVAESGIRSSADLVTLRSVGYDAFLVGEALMSQADPGAELRTMLEGAGQVARPRRQDH